MAAWWVGSIANKFSALFNYSLGPNAEKIDLVVTLGGDGTILHASSLFSVAAVPPVLSFSMGTLGFLLPFRKPSCSSIVASCSHLRWPDIDDFAKALDSVFRGKATILNRMRLACSFYDTNAEKIGDYGDGLYLFELL
jgi:NADH kinase